jgi:peptidyl-tRNA hydrolase
VRGQWYTRERDLGDYVLEPFAVAEREVFEESVGRSVEALRIWLSEGIEAAMRSANVQPSSPGGASHPD